MSFWERAKSDLGGKGSTATVASAATLNLPDNDNVFFVTGSTTVTSLMIPSHLRRREVTLIGDTSANVTFTHTASPTTAGEMYLVGSNRTLLEGTVLKMFCRADGIWQLTSNLT